MSPYLRSLYRQCRSVLSQYVSPNVVVSRDSAIVLRKWECLESLGYVRLREEVDPNHDPRDYWDEEEQGPIPDGEWDAYGSIGEYRTDLDSEEWIHGGSVWGHTGYRDVLDWKENAYILDIMRETLDAFRDERKRTVLVSPVPAY